MLVCLIDQGDVYMLQVFGRRIVEGGCLADNPLGAIIMQEHGRCRDVVKGALPQSV
jgi:hypothetical protein